MLVIRKEQMDALADAGRTRFEARMVEHLRTSFPEWARALGGEPLRGFVRHGIGRAQRHGFVVELDLARYLHVMQALGPHFDDSPEHPWAAALLARDLPAAEKMSRLRDAADCQVEARRIRNGG